MLEKRLRPKGYIYGKFITKKVQRELKLVVDFLIRLFSQTIVTFEEKILTISTEIREKIV